MIGSDHLKYIIKEVIEDLNESNTFHSYDRMKRSNILNYKYENRRKFL